MNMSYCAFENTYRDLRQCLDILEDDGPKSDSEIKFAKDLLELCKELANDWDLSISERAAKLKGKAP